MERSHALPAYLSDRFRGDQPIECVGPIFIASNVAAKLQARVSGGARVDSS